MKQHTPEEIEAFRQALIAEQYEDDDGMGGTYLLGWLMLILLMLLTALAVYGLSTMVPGLMEIFPNLRG